jgi:UDP-glucose 4-epimerase
LNILITGVAGLIGSKLAEWILDNTTNTVIGIDDLSGGYIENVDARIDFINCDLTSEVEKLNGVFDKNKIDIVYHLAAYAAEGLSPFIRRYNYENNLISSVNLINNAIKHSVKRFVFTSSMAVYGDQDPPFHEGMRPSPIDPYGVAKYAVELDLKIAHEQHGLAYTIIRPHNVYGENQNIWDKYRNVLGIWMHQIKNDINPTIYGDGLQTRAFSYIGDVLEPLWRASQSPLCIGETINLGGIKENTILDACNTLIEVTNTTLTPVFLEQRHEAKHAFSTWEKSVDMLKFDHRTSLKVGLEKMWQWAKELENKEQFVWDAYEIEKGLYPYWRSK